MARVERLADPTPMPGEHIECSDPPCSPEDGWCCSAHHHRLAERVGRHRAVWNGSLDDLDAVTIHEITDKAWGKR